MKKNDEFSRKSTPFLKSACLALCLVSFGGTAAYAESSYATHTMLTVQMNGKSIKDVFSYIQRPFLQFLKTNYQFYGFDDLEKAYEIC